MLQRDSLILIKVKTGLLYLGFSASDSTYYTTIYYSCSYVYLLLAIYSLTTNYLLAVVKWCIFIHQFISYLSILREDYFDGSKLEILCKSTVNFTGQISCQWISQLNYSQMHLWSTYKYVFILNSMVIVPFVVHTIFVVILTKRKKYKNSF